ncbi:MAG: hypothetical protein A3F83_01015 [Candidatus Glassbacteria bacterium RIFCSPLOWO2_12_FULL_58_11]|uniref:Response regulatory domain-containing protein n=2 Tax=Candidatus Glassiibacteriota TaxID=1817805 RepID=A0A1F5YYF5_9BACT|nr:MAG: hypothetical protein A2Z86_05085 [Candidatus Glassbacteria bacterium GWA2_58_10]OGG05230.1 MAG: hypothetical protein A3F83_01015 [Candidatus Glassbacteria bacterium RIFCSPLOWO2_12_FULL_58_11]
MPEYDPPDEVEISQLDLAPFDNKQTGELPEPQGGFLTDQAEIYARELRKKSAANKIQPLKKLAEIGGLKHLKYILPLSQYSSEFIRKMARNSAIRIILRSLREAEESGDFSAALKKKFIDLLIILDKKFSFMEKFQLEDPRITRVIFEMLSQENREFTAQKLAEVITDADERVRATAVKIIAEMLNQTETSLLVKLLRDPDARVRANVIEALESIGDSNVIGILMRYKTDRDSRVRANAIKALWNLGYRDVETSLREMLSDPDPKMRSAAVWAIGETGSNRPKIKDLMQIVELDEDARVKGNVLRARKKIDWREKEFRVLVIDNDRAFLHDMFRKMARDGLHINAAFDGKAGVSAALKQKPDLIVLDLHIPQLNGLKVLETLKKNPATRHIPIVTTCEIKVASLANKALEAGAADHLIKPFNYEDFREAVFKLV